MDKNFCATPVTMIETPPEGYKGSASSKYDGEEGLPKRTNSPNAVPEVVRDGAIPTTAGGFETEGPAKPIKDNS